MQITGSLIAKSGVALLAVGGIGVAGWKISNNDSKKEKEIVSRYLTRRERRLASTDTDWDGLKTFYSQESSSHPIPNVAKDGVTKEDIRDWCSLELKKVAETQSKAHLLLVESWCSKPQKLSERLLDIKKTKLDVNGGNDSSKWEEYRSSYSSSENKLKVKKKEASTQVWQDFENNQVTTQILQEWCKGHENNHFKYKEDTLFELYIRWCSK